jgi:hypothetical protein
MSKFFTRERFGQPQVFAGILLLIFFAQCAWLTSKTQHQAPDWEQAGRIQWGLHLWGRPIFSSKAAKLMPATPESSDTSTRLDLDNNHSALWYLIISAPFVLCPIANLEKCIETHLWLAVTPNLIFAVLLGASLWYVARRLYGNAGGYIALAFYCFSPSVILSSAMWFAQPEMGTAWGAFGAIFTAIAVSHTLYAPREVVLWNWRRILLLGLSFVLAVGSQFSLIYLVPIALLFMFYLAPARKKAAFTIWISACVVGFLLLFASYGFRPNAFFRALYHADFLGLIWQAFTVVEAYLAILRHLASLGPAVLAALPVVLIVYAFWRRTRYFGNTAPLLVAAFLLFLNLGSPHYPGFGFGLMAVPFLFVFMAGVIADLLETKHHALVLTCTIAVLSVGAVWNIWQIIFHVA